ncbi:MAG: PAS domain S-box protein [Actinomycetota bacterium]
MSGSDRRRPRLSWAGLPLRAKGLVVVAIPVLSLLAVTLTFLAIQRDRGRVSEQRERAVAVRQAARTMLVDLLTAQSTTYRFLLTGDELLRETAERAATALPDDLERLSEMLADEPEHVARLAGIRALTGNALSLLSGLRRRGLEDPTTGLFPRAEEMTEALYQALEEIVSAEDRETDELAERSAAVERSFRAAVIVSVGLGLVGGVVAMLLFASGVVRRVRLLETNAGLLAAGKPLTSLPPGRDEVAGLGRAMDAAASLLREAQDLLKGVIDGTPDTVYVKDLQGRYLLMNRAGATYLDRDPDDVVGRTDEELYPADLAGTIREADRAVIETEDIVVYESTDTSGDAPRHFLTSKGPYRDGSGDVAGIFGISREITDRVLAEQERDRFFTLSQDLFAIADLEGRFVRLNPAWEQVLGYSVEELTGRSFVDFIHPEDRERTEAEAARLAEVGNESVAFENRYRNRDGSYRWFMWKARADVQAGRIFAAARDITERKLAEAQMEEVNAALSESEERFRHLFANSPDAVIMIDPHASTVSWPIVDCNEAACRMNGYTREELLGQTVDILKMEPGTPEERAEYLERLRREGLVSIETHHRHKDGHAFPVEISTSVISLNGRELVMGIDRDITERRRLEKEAADRAEDLARSNQELEQFAYVASHDLQEPLRIVAGYAQLLTKRYRGTLGQDADEFIEYMVDGVRRMQALIDALLQYSRVGRKGREMAPVDLDVAFDDAMANLQAAIEESQARVTRDDLPDVVADRLQLAQLFQNLIGNALKFKGEEPPAVHVGAERHNGEWILEVRDNGIGIEPQYVDRIFDIFERLHSRERYDGTGIGLSICKKIVERHGGRIWVESDAGRGSAFRFTIPATQEQ